MSVVIGKNICNKFFIGELKEVDGKAYLTKAYQLIVVKNNEQQIITKITPIMEPFDNRSIERLSIKFMVALVDAPKELKISYNKLTTDLYVVPNN